MKKLTLFLPLLLFCCLISAQKTIHIYNQTYVVKGDLVCESDIVEPDREKESIQRVDCYLHLNDHQLVYSRVFSVDKIITLLDVYEVDINMFDLKNAIVDLEIEYTSNPAIYCVQLTTLEDKTLINNTQYDGKTAPTSYKKSKLNIDFNDEKKAKEYLKELKAAGKK